MSKAEIRSVFLEELGNIAPEADVTGLEPKADLRAALEIDSMDFLNLIVAIHTRIGIDIPERDYPKLFTLAGAVDYLAAAYAQKHAPA